MRYVNILSYGGKNNVVCEKEQENEFMKQNKKLKVDLCLFGKLVYNRCGIINVYVIELFNIWC